jgi:8-oxo-dGTP pyrophosphatase MutT (NUDIX family)
LNKANSSTQLPNSKNNPKKEIPNMNHTTISETFDGKKPNLGGMTLNLVAKDDALFVEVVPVAYIEYGLRAMPFLHPWFAFDYYKNHSGNKELANRLEMIFQLSRIRNHRVMRKVNAIIATREGKKQFQFGDMPDIETVIRSALDLGIDPSKYLDESTDEDDVQQCSNDWCLNQNTACGKAADNVQIITDLDGIDWLVLIVRQFGPGRAQLAWAGGLVDKGETFKAAALREKDEETEVTLSSHGTVKSQLLMHPRDASNLDFRYESGVHDKSAPHGTTQVNVTTTQTELKPVKMMDWDPRAKFVEGMEVGAMVTHHRFQF